MIPLPGDLTKQAFVSAFEERVLTGGGARALEAFLVCSGLSAGVDLEPHIHPAHR